MTQPRTSTDQPAEGSDEVPGRLPGSPTPASEATPPAKPAEDGAEPRPASD